MLHLKLNVNQLLVRRQLVVNSFLKFVSEQFTFHNHSQLSIGSSRLCSKLDVEKPVIAANDESFDPNYYNDTALLDAEPNNEQNWEETVQTKAMGEKAYLDILTSLRRESFHVLLKLESFSQNDVCVDLKDEVCSRLEMIDNAHEICPMKFYDAIASLDQNSPRKDKYS